ncbi:MAG: HDIG domain-containing protein, partial [Caldiserica bacterium]|nr:HDIG domain-containing protein [Caldisericota bacterium]
NLQVGSISQENIIAKRTVSFVDTNKTNELREKIAESVSPVYRFDTKKQQVVSNNIDKFFSDLINVVSLNAKEDEKKSMLDNILGNNSQYTTLILKENVENLNKLKTYIYDSTYKLMITGVRSDELSQAIKIGSDDIKNSNFNDQEKSFLIYVLEKFLQPNLIYDSAATENAKEEIMKSVPSVKITIQEGSIVVNKGDKITQDNIEILQALGLVRSRDAWKSILNIIFLIFISIGVSYLSIIKSKVVNDKNLIKKTAEFLITFAITYLLASSIKGISYYIIPIPLFAMILFEFTDFPTTLILSIAFLLIVSIPINMSPILILTLLLSIVIYLIALRKTSRISTFIYAGIIGGGIFSIATLLSNLSAKEALSSSLLNSIFSFTNFFISTIIAIGFVYILEHVFNEVTDIRLLELSDTKNPLLKELLLKASGTYQHSMMVANMASNAAEAIGANELLTKVGAYYHDIGKMIHPYYFTENQQMIPNIHNNLSPNLSKTVIINHIKDGVQLARQYKLPDEIIKFVATHHGRTVVSYFYHKAKEHDPNLSKEDFRYPGPLPESKETAILMLADAIEAASHSIEEMDYGKIEDLANSIIQDRVTDGQLDQSEITFSELKIIKESFVKNLISLYHKREKYPDGKENKG